MTEIYSLLGTLAFCALMFFVSKWLVPKCKCLICEWREFRDLYEQVNKKGGLEDQVDRLTIRVNDVAARTISIENNVDASSNKTEFNDKVNAEVIGGNKETKNE